VQWPFIEQQSPERLDALVSLRFSQLRSTRTVVAPTNEELLADLRRVEAARAQKQAEFLRGVDEHLPHAQLCTLKSELDALTELASAAVRSAIEGVNSNCRKSDCAEPAFVPEGPFQDDTPRK
jgi:hypothetical protein